MQIPLWMAYILVYSYVRVKDDSRLSNLGHDRDFADFTIPGPFNTRVQNALRAEPTSVKLAGLVGAGGLWYGFGRMLLSLYVIHFQLHSKQGWTNDQKLPRLDDEHGDLMSALLARVRDAATPHHWTAFLKIVTLDFQAAAARGG